MVKMPKPLTPTVKTPLSFWTLVFTPILATGLVSIVCQSSKVYAGLPNVQIHLRHLEILTKLQQELYANQRGLINTVPQIGKADPHYYTESNFSKISVRATKEVVLNHGITKPEGHHHSSLKNLVGRALILSQSPQTHSNQVKNNNCPLPTPSNHNFPKAGLRANIPKCTINGFSLD